MTAFTYDSLPGRVVFGAVSARTGLLGEVDAFGARRILVIAAEPELELVRDLTRPLRELGMRENDIDAVLDDILNLVPDDNPRTVDRIGLRSLLRAAWAGTEPAKEAA